MSNKCTILKNPDLLRDITDQNDYCGVTRWNQSEITGEGVVIWNMERHTDHGCQTHDRVLDAAPGATVLNGALESSCDAKEIQYCRVAYQPEDGAETQRYELEEFIRKFKVKIVTRSFGGILGYGERQYPMDKLWLELQKKYNLIFFNSAGNNGNEQKDRADSISILVQAANLRKGKPVRDGYSSTLVSGDSFIDFRGWNNGTSFSAPYLAGKTALLVQRYGDISQEEVVAYWKDHVEDLGGEGYDMYHGYGLPMLGDVEEEYFGGNMETKKFEDVKEGSWYEKAVNYCVDQGYMAGLNATQFGPEKPLTRAQLAQVLYNIDHQIKM